MLAGSYRKLLEMRTGLLTIETYATDSKEVRSNDINMLG